MKKAKIIMSAIGLLAIVAGTMAYKANKLQKILFTCDANGWCTIGIQATTVISDASGPAITFSVWSTISTTACSPTVWIYPTN